MADDSDDWISAADAIELLKRRAMDTFDAQMTICARANDGLIQARARALTRLEEHDVPLDFWWDRGGSMLKQNWRLGDFERRVQNGGRHRWRAYGVRFLRSQIIEILPEVSANAEPQNRPAQGTKIFIGHGRSAAWHELKAFIVERLKLPYDEFNAESVAGVTNTERLSKMLVSVRKHFESFESFVIQSGDLIREGHHRCGRRRTADVTTAANCDIRVT